MVSPQSVHEFMWALPSPPQRPAASSEPRCSSRRANCSARLENLHDERNRRQKPSDAERSYVCTIESCGKRFSTSGNFTRHKRLHALEKFPCPAHNCSREYKSAERLEKHMRAHMGKSAYPCTVHGCSKAFSTSGNLGRHFRACHVYNDSTSLHRGSANSAARVTTRSAPQSTARASGTLHGARSNGDSAFAPFVTPPSDSLSPEEVLDFLVCLFVADSPSDSFTEDTNTQHTAVETTRLHSLVLKE